jgi:uncharacterized protein YegL
MSDMFPEDVVDTPGGEMNFRPVHFFWILDGSSSMGVEGKIAELNFAIRDAIPDMRRVAGDNPKASLVVRVLTFSTGANWHVAKPTEIDDFSWSDIHANGVTDMGKAFDLLAKELNMPPMPQRALPPVLALLSDGQPTDDWKGGLERLNKTPWGKRAVRVAIAIGRDANRPMLQEFLGNPELEVIDANNPAALAAAIRWASTVAVQVASQGRDTEATKDTTSHIPVADDDDDDIW